MGFPQPCVSDEDEIEGIFDPGGVDEGQDVVLAELGIEMPVELIERFDMFNPRLDEKPFDLMLPSVFDLHFQEVQDRITPVRGYLLDRCLTAQFLKQGFKNCVSINGTSIPKSVKDLCHEKIVTIFVDGDRGGELIVKELSGVTDIDYVARAPDGKEVEEITQKKVQA